MSLRNKGIIKTVGGLLIGPTVLMLSLTANAADNELSIVTSFPSDLTKVFKREFQEAYPDIKVEILKKKTTAGVKYIQETSEKTELIYSGLPHLMRLKFSKTILYCKNMKAV